MQIDGTDVPDGNRQWLSVPVAVDADMRSITVHLCVINGVRQGPTVWLQGNVHGDEPVGGRAIRDFVLDVEPGEVAGTIVACPVANPIDFLNKQRGAIVNNQEPRDAGRAFPGTSQGGFASRLAERLYSIADEHADYVLEAHSPDKEIRIEPGFAVIDGEAAVRAESASLAHDLTVGQLVELSRDTVGGFLMSELAHRGVPGVLLETGSGATTHDWAYDTYVDSIRNFATSTGTLDGDIADQVDVQTYEDVDFVTTPAGGFTEPAVTTGDRVDADGSLGTVTNIRGDVVADIHAPRAGIVAGMKTYPVSRPGDVFAEVLVA